MSSTHIDSCPFFIAVDGCHTKCLPLDWQIFIFPSPWVAKVVSTHPRGTGTVMMPGNTPSVYIYTNKWQYCLHMCKLYDVFLKHVKRVAHGVSANGCKRRPFSSHQGPYGAHTKHTSDQCALWVRIDEIVCIYIYLLYIYIYLYVPKKNYIPTSNCI